MVIEQYVDIERRLSLVLKELTTLHSGYKLPINQEALVMEAKGVIRELSMEIARNYISELKSQIKDKS